MAILTMFRHRFYKNDGTVNAGGKVYTYTAGTTTPTATYTTSAGDVANTNPIILNSKGEADIWVTGQIKVNVLESDDTQVTGWPVDNIGSSSVGSSANALWAGTATGTANALTLTPSTAISAYAVGQSFIFKAGASSNSGATTVAISGLSAIAVQSNGAACSGGEILASKFYLGVLDTLTTFQISKIGEQVLTWTTITADPNPAVAGSSYMCNTTSAAFTVTLPAAPAANDFINIADYAGTFATNNLTIGRNGLKIMGLSEDMTIRTNNASITLTYIDATQGWRLT